MNEVISTLNSIFSPIHIVKSDVENVIGKVNKEMKLNGWILMELKNEGYLIMNKELQEEYLLSKHKGLKMKGMDEIETVNDIIDKENGIRFEGSVFEGIPFGFGYLFDENGNKIYEGMMINWNRMGYGISYNEKGMKEYEGTWCNDLRCGYGKSFDNEGNVIFEGNWFNRNHADDYDGDGNDLNTQVKRLKLNDKCILNDFDISLFLNLEELIIGNNCFENVNEFKIDGLNHLKSLKIGMNSFTKEKNGEVAYNPNRSFSILNCIELESIEIGECSFFEYGGGFELDSLPKLSTIKIGNDCFSNVDIFNIDGLNELKSLKIGSRSFSTIKFAKDWNFSKVKNDCSRSFGILNCGKLESIEIGRFSFAAFGDKFELRNLPILSTVSIESIEIDTSASNDRGWSLNFFFSSFEIRGIIDMIMIMNRSS